LFLVNFLTAYIINHINIIRTIFIGVFKYVLNYLSMADTVVINVDGKQIEIPEFAYDRSMQDLIKVARALGVDAKKTAGTNESIRKSLKAILDKETVQVKQGTAEAQSEKKHNKNHLEKLKKVEEQLSKNGKQQGIVNKALAATGGSGGVFPGLFGGLSKFSKFLNPVTAGLAGLASGIIAATKFFLKLGQLDNTLFRRGFDIQGEQGLSGGVTSFAAQAADASLSLDNFSELMQEFATTAGEFGTGTMSSAIVGVQNLTKSQSYLGLSNQELAAATAESADILRQLGFDSSATSMAIAQTTTNVLQTTQAFTRLLNVSNDVIRNMTIQASQIESFTNALQMLPTNLRGQALQSSQTAFAGLAAFGEEAGGQLTTALSEGIGRGGMQFTQFGQDLARVSPSMLTALQDLQSASTSGGDVTGALDSFREAIATTDESSRQFLRALEISGDPMAKFVIKLANLNESIDDTTFKQMAEIRKNINPEKLGQAQNELRMGIEKIKAAFDKLLISVLSPEVINGFSTTVKSLSDMIGSLADWIKTTGFGMLQNAMNTLVGFFSGAGTKIAGIFDGLSSMLSGAVGSGIARGIAIAMPGGDNAKKLDMYDSIADMLKGNENNPEALKKAYAMLRRNNPDAKASDSWATHFFNKSPDGVGRTQNYIQNEMGEYFAQPLFNKKASSSSGSTYDEAGIKPSSTSMFATSSTPSRSKIRIMPMYGDPKSMVEKTPAQETNELLKKQIEVLEEQVRILSQNSGEQKKATNELSKISANNYMSHT
jgi:hypothetical protein